MTFEQLLKRWDGEEVVLRHDAVTGAWMFVGVHSTVRGPGMGGTRLKVYDRPEDGLEDVLRLSGAMTLKQAAADLPFGGGKAVIAVDRVPEPDSAERRSLLLRYAELVDSLHGTYVTAADMNTGERDMDVIGERTPHVLGRSPAHDGAGDPGAATALGTFHGVRAALAHWFGTDELLGRSVMVQGLGSVGSRLAEHLHDAGADLLVADVDEARATSFADGIGAKVVAPEDVIHTPCDVLAPCATGNVVNGETIPHLRCRIVAGAANNQLGSAPDADRLREAGILYAPDYVINSGGVIHLAGRESLGWDDRAVEDRLRGIGDTLTEVFRIADEEGVSTEAAAGRLARARLVPAA